MVLNKAETLWHRLSDEQLQDVLVTASRHIDAVWNVMAIEKIPLSDQMILLRRLARKEDLVYNTANNTVRLILGVVAQLDELAAKSFWVEMQGLLGNIHASVLLQHAWLYFREERRERAPTWLHDHVVDRAELDGYVFGTVGLGWHRGLGQMQVNHLGVIYLHDSSAHRYRPAVDDRVIIDINRSRQIAPGVLVATFVPVDPRLER